MSREESKVGTTGEQKRYNEKDAIKKFLVSGKGITFLVDHINRREARRDTHYSKQAIEAEVDNLVDYYFAWIHSFPVRKEMQMSKYEFLKYLEAFCGKSDVGSLFEFLFI